MTLFCAGAALTMGSPKAVPVPCISSIDTSHALKPPPWSADLMTACCKHKRDINTGVMQAWVSHKHRRHESTGITQVQVSGKHRHQAKTGVKRAQTSCKHRHRASTGV